MKALITGITGQDGSYLAELLLEKGYAVWGLSRSSWSSRNRDSIDPRVTYVSGDLRDTGSIREAIAAVEPDEIYNLGAQSHVGLSFKLREHSMDVGLGVVRIMDAVLDLGFSTRIYQASTSEMFGNAPPPQNEQTVFNPRSPYAVSKVMAHNAVRVYRESYGIHASCGILFNHESERRPEAFVTRKVTAAAARIARGSSEPLMLGNLDARRDWGYAPDYVEAMWLMLQQPEPDDYVIATGESHTVGELVERAFSYVDLDWKQYVQINDQLKRPNEVNFLCGDASKARQQLNWKPKTTFNELVTKMVEHDL